MPGLLRVGVAIFVYVGSFWLRRQEPEGYRDEVPEFVFDPLNNAGDGPCRGPWSLLLRGLHVCRAMLASPAESRIWKFP